MEMDDTLHSNSRNKERQIWEDLYEQFSDVFLYRYTSSPTYVHMDTAKYLHTYVFNRSAQIKSILINHESLSKNVLKTSIYEQRFYI